MFGGLLIINSKDNVATALKDLCAGTEISLTVGGQRIRIQAKQDINFCHKIALTAIPKGAEIIKYGQIIGVAAEDIGVGEHVHIHNVASQRGRGDLRREVRQP